MYVFLNPYNSIYAVMQLRFPYEYWLYKYLSKGELGDIYWAMLSRSFTFAAAFGMMMYLMCQCLVHLEGPSLFDMLYPFLLD